MPSRARFGEFEWHAESGELRHGTSLTRLQPQPARVLSLLIEHAGQVVTREEIQREVWPDDTFVDFEQGLYFCIRYLRRVLGENGSAPRHIETIPKRGYRFLGVDGATDAANVPATRLRLAILRFESLGGDNDYFAEGLTAEMITEASRIAPRRLAVMAPSSVRQRRPGDRSLADALRADYVLEGTVRRNGNRVRITAHLIHARDQAHLWSEGFDGDLAAVFDIQKQVANRIATALALELLPSARRVPPSPVAHDAYLHGRFELHQLTGDSLRRSLVWFERALSIDPDYVSAHAGLAETYLQLGHARAGFMAPRDAMPKAHAAAVRALELDGTSSEAHAANAAYLMWHEWDWPAAEAGFRLALQLNPSNARARVWYSLLMAYVARFAEASEEIERALELDPFSPLVNTYVGAIAYLQGDVDRALTQLERTARADPGYGWVHYFRGLTLRQAHRYDDAIAAFEQVIRLSPGAASALGNLGNTLCQVNQHAAARAILNELTRMRANQYVCPTALASIHIGLGELDRAMECLKDALAERSGSMSLLKVEPVYQPLRTHPGFTALASALRLS